jgi:hypothetical protein
MDDDQMQVMTGPPTPTSAREARAAREAVAETVFLEEVRRVEAQIRRFSEELDQLTIRVAVAGENFERLAQIYREAGWLVSGSAGDFLMELPAPVEGVHPDRRQAGGEPVLDFWRFVYERQAIYARRLDGLPRPWTTDPVLRERFFTNIFRDLDPGTAVARDIVSAARPAWERLWNLMVYRRFNRESTWGLIDYRELGDDLEGSWSIPVADQEGRRPQRSTRFDRVETDATREEN